MNKKIKIIDVINKIANGEIPKAIKYYNKIYKYVKNNEEEGYLNADFGGDWLINVIHWDDIKELNEEVEILEDNTEEIDELKYDVVDENGRGWYKLDTIADKVTELIKAVNEIRKDLNK